MEKLPRSGPLYNAVEEIYSRKNLFDETKPVSEIVQEAAKKYNISAEKLKSVLPYANEVFEGGPLSNPKLERKINGGKFSEELPRAKTMADEMRKINGGKFSEELTRAKAMADEIRKINGGKTFPLSPENVKALGRAVDDDYAASIRKVLAEQGAPMETPYGKSFLSYTPEGKVAGVAGKMINTASGVAKQALKAGMKAAGPVGAALTAAELGEALSEVRKLGAEKIAAENEAKQAGYTPEERLKLKEMLKKLKGNPALRE